MENMMTTDTLPELPTPKYTETIRGVPCITVTEHEHLMREYALQAIAQVQGEPVWFHKNWGEYDDIFYRPNDVIPDDSTPLYTNQLPPLPEPEGVIVVGTQALRAFTADQMRAYALRTAIQQAESEPCKSFAELRDRHREGVDAELAAMAAKTKTDEPVGYENEMGELIKFPPPCIWMGADCPRKKAIANTPDCYELLYTHPAPGVPDDVQRDAERYRWLRSLEHCNEAWCFIGSGNANSNLDAAIDAAMLTAAQAQKGQP